MSQKTVAAAEGPTLDDWMAKIREKKLRPVIPNQHKSTEDVTSKKSEYAGPHEVNEIVKMRQGLRSVSTPKWPGVNDNKAKTNTTALPGRAQLRSVSDRTTNESTSESAKSVTNATAETTQIKTPTSIGTIENLEQVDEGEFPLDVESSVLHTKVDTEASIEPEKELSVSSGIVDPKAKIELVLPDAAEEDFPLDCETPAVQEEAAKSDAKEPHEIKTPITISTGVFETDAGEIELKLPTPKETDFPLDVEEPEKIPHAEEAHKTHDLTVSSGVVQESSTVTELEPPPKVKDQSTEAINKMSKLEMQESQDDPGTISATPHDKATSNDMKPDATSVDIQESSKPILAEKESAIKCSNCGNAIDMDDLAEHKC